MFDFFGNNSGFIIPKKTSGDDAIDPAFIWSSERVEKLLSDYADGKVDMKSVKNTPFFHRDISYRAPKIAFKYTVDELRELQKASDDVIYFATNFVKIKDEEGRILKIEKLRDYQYEIIETFRDSKQTILMASRQIGKCQLPDTEVVVREKGSNEEKITPLFKLYFESIKKKRRLSFIERIKYKLYKKAYKGHKKIKSAILKLIKILEKYEYRNHILDENDITKKIIGSIDIDGYEIKTDSGFSNVSDLHITQPYQIYELDTENGKHIECADNHIVFNNKMQEVFVSELNVGDYIQTDEGISKVKRVNKTKYKVGMMDITVSDKNHRYYGNGILSHNTITSAIFIVHYMLFNKDKNVMIVADNSITANEIIDKVRSIVENLPFYMKPGMITNNVRSLKFDNNCRLIGRTTTKKTGIGFSIDLLYMDEFAHINEGYLNFFYRSIYPTISGIKNSKIIITSTPNGTNKFYEIWIGALEGKNNYVPLRVDYWQVPGRDAVWKEKTIADLGSVEDFNQEYGLQFYSSDQLMLDSNDVKKIHAMKTEYVSRKVNALSIEYEGYPIDYSRYLKFHPNFLNTTFKPHMEDLKSDNDIYVLSIDSADGVGRDYSVVNIFKMKELPISYLIRNRTIIREPMDIFSLFQVGSFRTNTVNIHTFSDIIRKMIYDLFNTENVVVVLELNHKGEIVKDRIESHARYFPGLLIHTKHKVDSQYFEPGIILNSFQKKKEYCDSFTYKISINKILPNEKNTVLELSSFGRVNNSTSFRAQSGNDDLAITSINVSPFFESPQYYEFGELLLTRITDRDYIDRLNEEIIEYNARELEQDKPFSQELLTEISNLG